MFAAFSSLGSNQKMKIVAFVDHNIILAWYGRARRTSGQAMPARRFPPFPQFCLKISTFAGIIVQAELTNQCEAYLGLVWGGKIHRGWRLTLCGSF